LRSTPDSNGALLYRVNAGGRADQRHRPRGARVDRLGRCDRWSAASTTAPAARASLRLTPGTGEVAWSFRSAGLGAAPTAIPGVVFQGAGDGRLARGFVDGDGKLLWQFNTAAGVQDREQRDGARRAIASSGAVIVDGMVFVGSGYAINSGATAGNVLLAFGID
jgi:hypothetical protein